VYQSLAALSGLTRQQFNQLKKKPPEGGSLFMHLFRDAFVFLSASAGHGSLRPIFIRR
jgi:hypothetical protein